MTHCTPDPWPIVQLTRVISTDLWPIVQLYSDPLYNWPRDPLYSWPMIHCATDLGNFHWPVTPLYNWPMTHCTTDPWPIVQLNNDLVQCTLVDSIVQLRPAQLFGLIVYFNKFECVVDISFTSSDWEDASDAFLGGNCSICHCMICQRKQKKCILQTFIAVWSTSHKPWLLTHPSQFGEWPIWPGWPIVRFDDSITASLNNIRQTDMLSVRPITLLMVKLIIVIFWLLPVLNYSTSCKVMAGNQFIVVTCGLFIQPTTGCAKKYSWSA